MLIYKTYKLISVTVLLLLLSAGCTTTHSVPAPDRTQTPVPSNQQVLQEPATRSPAPRESEQISPPAPQQLHKTPESEKTQVAVEVKVDFTDIEFVQLRLAEYENKFQYWLELYGVAREGELAEELTALEADCIQNFERILIGYSLLLERLMQSDVVPFERIATVDPKKMQQLDIAFLESRCNELLVMDIPGQYELRPEAPPGLSFDALQHFPDKKPSLATRMNYGLALQFTGQVEAAARHFKNMLGSGDLTVEPLTLQRIIADLLLAGGNVAAAESYYDSIILGHESIGTEKTWAEEQLAFMRSVDPESEDMTAYMKLLREFQMYDYRVDAARANEAVNIFAAEYAGSPVAVSALRLKTFAMDQLKLWFSR
ncbi:MAG: hypothetical protein AMK70_14160, partial [Nitrospira bacterium SG8_35_1]